MPSSSKQRPVTDEDRDLYIREFRKCELARSKIPGTPLAKLLETSFDRAFFHETFHSHEVHQKWFQQHRRNSMQRLLLELDDFCKTNSNNLEGLEDEVVKFRASIWQVEEERLSEQGATRLE